MTSIAVIEDKAVSFICDINTVNYTIKIVKTSTQYLLTYNSVQTEFVNSVREVEYKILHCLDKASRVKIIAPEPYPEVDYTLQQFSELYKSGVIRIGFYIGLL